MSEFEKKISVIIPFYNAEGTLERCLSSVTAQKIDKDGLEVILVNDGSTDGSADIAKSFASQNNYATIITQQHSGSGAARNSGITAARGKYIAFLDADDTLSPEALGKISDFFELNADRTDIVTYTLVPYSNSGRKKSGSKAVIGTTDVYDLSDAKNKYFCPDSVNVAVKNKGDENLLFDASQRA